MDNIAEELLATTEVETKVETPATTEEKGATEEVKTEEVKTEEVKTEEVKTETKTGSESPSEKTKTETTVPIAAMHGERDRRQDLQKEFDAYKVEHPEKEPEKAPSIFEDEAGFLDHRDQRNSEILMNTLLNEGKAESIAKHGQELTDKAEAWFAAEVQKSPMLAKQLQGASYMQQHRMVVDIYQNEMSRQDANQNPEEHDARMKAQGVEEYLAQQEADKADKKAVIDSIPKSLVGDSSAGTITSSDWSGPTPLNKVIADH